MSLFRFLLVAVAVCSLDDVRRIECNIACRKGGYESGTYQQGRCYCFDAYDYGYFVGTAPVTAPLPRQRAYE